MLETMFRPNNTNNNIKNNNTNNNNHKSCYNLYDRVKASEKYKKRTFNLKCHDMDSKTRTYVNTV